MRPKIITHKTEPEKAWLIDTDSVSAHPFIAGNGKTAHRIEGGNGIVDMLNGKTRTHFETSIYIADLRAGEFALHVPLEGRDMSHHSELGKDHAGQDVVALWMDGLALPKPCVYVPFKDYQENDPMSRGIPPSAARALLALAASRMNITSQRALGRWKFDDSPAIEGTAHSWQDSKFITAWLWGKWQDDGRRAGKKVSCKDRWEEIRSFGYDKDFSGFRSMVSRLKLSVAD